MKRLSTLSALFAGTLVVGSFDITFAITFWAFRGATPTRVLQSVASGLLGRASFSGGVRTAFLGLALHYFIAFCVVAVYLLASRRMRTLIEHPIICGSIYGIGVYVVMNYVVIPLSAAGKGKFSLVAFVLSLIVHAFLIGVPAALFARAARRAI